MLWCGVPITKPIKPWQLPQMGSNQRSEPDPGVIWWCPCPRPLGGSTPPYDSGWVCIWGPPFQWEGNHLPQLSYCLSWQRQAVSRYGDDRLTLGLFLRGFSPTSPLSTPSVSSTTNLLLRGTRIFHREKFLPQGLDLELGDLSFGWSGHGWSPGGLQKFNTWEIIQVINKSRQTSPTSGPQKSEEHSA